MNSLDKQYQALLQDILANGVKKEDRTETGTISVFGRQIRHNMQEGFPLLTTKKMPFRVIATELLWFLRGDTNIKYLHDNNCHIWDGDYIKSGRTDGELGPIYGKQWRSWGRKNVVNYDLKNVKSSDKVKVMDLIRDGGDYSKYDVKVTYQNNSIDQIANLIQDLKSNPDSRRLMVSAWNVGELDQMTLPPCHYGFQVYTRELSFQERLDYYDPQKMYHNEIDAWFLDELKIPTRAISLMWNQRSVDTFLGLPFNIASYGLLLEIIAKAVNMVPDELIGNLGDTHLYLNHIEQAKEQIGRELTWEEKIQWVMKNTDVEMENLYITEAAAALEKSTREPYPLPTLKIEPEVKWKEGDCLPTYSVSDFSIENYESHPAIKAPLNN
jgi:thymidylate synthase